MIRISNHLLILTAASFPALCPQSSAWYFCSPSTLYSWLISSSLCTETSGYGPLTILLGRSVRFLRCSSWCSPCATWWRPYQNVARQSAKTNWLVMKRGTWPSSPKRCEIPYATKEPWRASWIWSKKVPM
ncbi:hypothetical protein B0H19DRAFT_1141678, partial [Mycena capillaripes]